MSHKLTSKSRAFLITSARGFSLLLKWTSAVGEWLERFWEDLLKILTHFVLDNYIIFSFSWPVCKLKTTKKSWPHQGVKVLNAESTIYPALGLMVLIWKARRFNNFITIIMNFQSKIINIYCSFVISLLRQHKRKFKMTELSTKLCTGRQA